MYFHIDFDKNYTRKRAIAMDTVHNMFFTKNNIKNRYFDFGKFSFFIVFFEKVQFLEQKNLFFHIFSHKTSIISYNFEYFSAPEMQICKDTYVLS